MSAPAQAAARAPRQAAPLAVHRVGTPQAVTGIARLLLEIHARPALSVVSDQRPQGRRDGHA